VWQVTLPRRGVQLVLVDTQGCRQISKLVRTTTGSREGTEEEDIARWKIIIGSRIRLSYEAYSTVLPENNRNVCS